MEGVLKSWAVPKGPSMNPADKRLAVMVEDHPMDYRRFEGEIPEGSYGAGIVKIWDEGTYHAENKGEGGESEQQLLEELKNESLRFVLNGKRLKGSFTLIKMKKGEPDAWLLIKQKDEQATEEPYDSEDFVEEAVKTVPKPKKARRTAVVPDNVEQALVTKATKTTQVKTESKNKTKKQADTDVSVEINGFSLTLSSLNKVYWPEEGYTKGELIHYYRQVARWMLPYLKDRPQSLHRHPNGLKDAGFYQRDIEKQVPDWIETIRIYSESTQRDLSHVLCQNEATLVYLNNLGCIEIHPWNSRVQTLEKPDYLAIDLDPGENTYDQVVEVALVVKQVMDQAGATCFCKTSGATGMHIFVPLGRQYDFDTAESFARQVAETVHAQLPKLTSLERSPKLRRQQIYLDYLQNNIGQSLAAVYSVRPKPGATVSTPLRWDEVKKGLHPSAFTIRTVPDRLNQLGDIFGGILGAGVNLDDCMERLRSSKK
jgi:bifunctional non-homologous end joining protein LigD